MLIFVLIVFMMGLFMLLERKFPAEKLEKIDNWWSRALIFNGLQFVLVVFGSYTWEKWLIGQSIFHLNFNPMVSAMIAYLINTLVFYWWHRARHEVYLL